MGPYVPSQGSANWLSYVDWNLAETLRVCSESTEDLLWQIGPQSTTLSGRGEWLAASLLELCYTSK